MCKQIIVAMIVVLGIGCASRIKLPAPSSEQERITLRDFQASQKDGTPLKRPGPVVTLPVGTVLTLRVPLSTGHVPASPFLTVKREKKELPVLQVKPFEGVGTAEMTIRVKEAVQLDFEQYLVSIDGKRWSRLGSYFLPGMSPDSRLTVTDSERRDIVLPTWTLGQMLVAHPMPVRKVDQ